MKRDLSILLIVLMIFSLGTINVKATEGDDSQTVVEETSEVEEKDNVGQDEEEIVFSDDSSLKSDETSDLGNEDVKEETNEDEISLTSLDETGEVEEKKYVAQIGDTKYETLYDAISANGGPIDLIDNVSFSSSISSGWANGIVLYNKDITLNLNSYTYNLDSTADAYNRGNVYYDLFFVGSGASLTINGEGTISSERGDFTCYGIYVNGGTVNINGGNYTGSPSAIHVYTGQLNISGGFFDLTESLNKHIKNNEYVCGGKSCDYLVNYIINAQDPQYKSGAARINITGGTFVNFDPSNNPEGLGTTYVAEGYKVVSETKENGDIWYTVIEATVATIGDTKYYSLQDAFDNANNGDTITLVDDVDLNNTVTVTKDVTLDMNGHTIFNSNSIWDDSKDNWSLISIRENGNLTITGNGKFDALKDDCYALDLFDKGTSLTIENGEYIGNLSSVYVYDGNLNIKNGEFDIKQKQSSGNPYALLINCLDESYKDGSANVTISGGNYVGFNPSNNTAENPTANYVMAGYKTTSETIDDVTWYTVSVDKDPLKEALDTYTSIIDSLSSGYCKSTVEAYTIAYNNAKAIYENDNVSVKKIDEVTKALNTAYDNLAKHELTHIEAKDATCTRDGNKEYYRCTKCNSLYLDLQTTKETTIEEITIKALGHDYKKVEAKEATIGSSGNIEYYTCERCLKIFVLENNEYKETTIDDVTISKVDATNLKDALETYEKEIDSLSVGYCVSTVEAYTKAYKAAKDVYEKSDSNKEDVDNALNDLNKAKANVSKHDLVKHEGVAETCTEDGYKTYYECIKCNTLYSDDKGENKIDAPISIPAKGHLMVTINEVAPTIGATGNVLYYRCSNCGKLFVKVNGQYTETTIDDVTLAKVDTSDLSKAIDNAISDLSIYTKATAQAYTNILKDAKATLNNDNSTKEDVENAIKKLENAKAILVEKTKANIPASSLKEGTYTSVQGVTISSDNDMVITVNGNKTSHTTIDLKGEIDQTNEYVIVAYTLGDDNHYDSDIVTFKYVIAIEKGEVKDNNPITDEITKSLNPETSDIDSTVVELKEEEKEAIDEGKNVNVTLNVKKAEQLDEIAEVRKALSNDSSLKSISTIDISLSVSIQDSDSIREITTTDKPISITLEVPEIHINKDDSKERTYYVIRTHKENNEIETKQIEGTFDKTNSTFTFETDRFSTYALVYKDTVKQTKKSSSNTSNTSSNTSKSCKDAIGEGWIWSERSKTCVYKVSNTGSK